jgi:hypothetical protein
MKHRVGVIKEKPALDEILSFNIMIVQDGESKEDEQNDWL